MTCEICGRSPYTDSMNPNANQPGDERAERRDRRRQAKRERMRKHGATTASTYRNAILKRLRRNAGRDRQRRSGDGDRLLSVR